MTARKRVADFWDDVLERWIERPADLEGHLVEPLPRWFKSYAGTGKGAVDLRCYPDPYVGDLRGETHDVRMVILGLNPGVGYPALQAHGGIWTERVGRLGYSHCFQRSPAEDPESWQELHGEQSRYWSNLIKFTRRWLRDDAADVHSILNLELFPWHSNAIVGKMTPPPDLINDFVWAPAQEVSTPVVFAFGAAWFAICDALELPIAAAWGTGEDQFPGMADDKGWRVVAYRLPSEQFAVVSSQPGYSGPPGEQRLAILRALLADLLADWEAPLPAGVVTPRATSHEADAAFVHEVCYEVDEERWPQRFRPGDQLPKYWQRGLLALQTVSELHQRGYQRLRIVPGMSGSGFDWRCVLVPASHLSGRAGFTIHDELLQQIAWEQERGERQERPVPPIVLWGPSDERSVFGVRDAAELNPAQLADEVLARYPELMQASDGRDWAYAGWLLERLWDARNGQFPIAYDNWDYSADHSYELRMMGPVEYEQLATRPLPPPP